jgi:hypothetical protein
MCYSLSTVENPRSQPRRAAAAGPAAHKNQQGTEQKDAHHVVAGQEGRQQRHQGGVPREAAPHRARFCRAMAGDDDPAPTGPGPHHRWSNGDPSKRKLKKKKKRKEKKRKRDRVGPPLEAGRRGGVAGRGGGAWGRLTSPRCCW